MCEGTLVDATPALDTEPEVILYRLMQIVLLVLG
jgi:hypothetical protein